MIVPAAQGLNLRATGRHENCGALLAPLTIDIAGRVASGTGAVSKLIEFGQGTQSMSPAFARPGTMILEKRLAHGNHPVLSMCAACAVVEGKDDANRKLSKNKSTGRIDGMIALAMAVGVSPLVKTVDVAALIG